jgi:hypothetical protein
MGMNPVEPHADMRMVATMMYQFYVALLDAGFNEEQAIRMVEVQLTAATKNSSGE